MKTALQLKMIGVLLYCSIAAAQEPPSSAGKVPFAGATVSDFKGKVTVQLPSQSFTAPARGEVLPAETTVNTDDGRLLLRLSDGSDVLVRPHTRLVLKQPETSGWRYLQLLLGRIHTQIQKHLGGTPPLQIGTPSAVISVRGTQFDVEVDRRGFTEVDVEEGIVQLDSVTGGESVMITAGFSSRVGMDSRPETPRPTHDLRPQLDRPSHREDKDSGDDDPVKKLEASDHDRHGQGDQHSGGGSSGSDGGGGQSGPDGGEHQSGSDSGDRHSGSDGGGQQSGSDSDHHGGSKPPDLN